MALKKIRHNFWRRLFIIAVASFMLAVFGLKVQAQDDSPSAVVETATSDPAGSPINDAQTEDAAMIAVDNMWVIIAGCLVFFMQAGFALLETGLVGQKGAVNALLENFLEAAVSAIAFWAIGFGVAFGVDSGNFIGTNNFFLSEAFSFSEGSVIFPSIADVNPDIAVPNLTVLTFFFFQFAFAATACTITTGAMAERTNYIGHLVYNFIMVGISYPIIVHWIWGGGWLADRAFHDFAGSTVIHTVGGVTAIIGAWMLGPRPNRIFGQLPPAHNLGLATLGTMILWLGWYGFNPGSTLTLSNPGLVGFVLLNTTLGAGAGALTSMFFVYARTGKWDLGYTLNGSLAGLVGVTAGCAFIAPWASVIAGIVAGIIVVLAVDFIESLKIDDPVGAFAVHGACGIWGTLAVGLFALPEMSMGDYAGQGGLLLGGGVDLLILQITGSLATIAFTATAAFAMFGALKAAGILRVDSMADIIGIDAYEHGVSIWPDVAPVADSASVELKKPVTSPASGD